MCAFPSSFILRPEDRRWYSRRSNVCTVDGTYAHECSAGFTTLLLDRLSPHDLTSMRAWAVEGQSSRDDTNYRRQDSNLEGQKKERDRGVLTVLVERRPLPPGLWPFWKRGAARARRFEGMRAEEAEGTKTRWVLDTGFTKC